MQNIINYTNTRLNNWYVNAKDYGVNGKGSLIIENNEAVINYTENGVDKKWSISLLNTQDERISYVFDVWMEQAA